MVDMFKSKAIEIRKNLSVKVSENTLGRIRKIEIEAEKSGNTFELNACVEDAILRLLKKAEAQLESANAIEVGNTGSEIVEAVEVESTDTVIVQPEYPVVEPTHAESVVTETIGIDSVTSDFPNY